MRYTPQVGNPHESKMAFVQRSHSKNIVSPASKCRFDFVLVGISQFLYL
jgi:hypothetical protein